MGIFDKLFSKKELETKTFIDGIEFEKFVINAKKSGTHEGIFKIWENVLSLNEWYLISTKEGENPDNDFVGHFDQTNFWMYIFTTKTKAQNYIDNASNKINFQISPKPVINVLRLLYGPSRGATFGLYVNETDREINAHFNIPIVPLEQIIKNVKPELANNVFAAEAFSLYDDKKLNSNDFSIDELTNKAKESGKPEDLYKLWQAALSLDEWHFIAKYRENIQEIKPFLGVVDDAGWAFVFTDKDKAQEYAKTTVNEGFLDPEGSAIIISMKTENAIKYLLNLKSGGVHGVRINELNGWFAPLNDLPVIINWLNKK